jgi:hypothetical protein
MRDTTNTYSRDVQDGAELIWVKPRRSKSQFELHAGEATVATLEWSGSTRAVALWGERHYQFSRHGWLRPRILVHAVDSSQVGEEGEAGTPIATFAQHGGVLSFPDGQSFLWKKPKWLTNERIWVDGAATELVRFHPARRGSVAVMTPPETAHQVERPLLILLGQYLIVLAARDAEAAGTAAAAAGAVIASS